MSSADTQEAAPEAPRTGWDRLGEPFAHALKGSPLRWGITVACGALLAWTAMTHGPPLTGETPSGVLTTLAWAVLLASLPLLVIVDAAIQILPNRVLYPVGAAAALLIVGDWLFGELSGQGLLRAVAVSIGMLIFSIAVVLIAPVGGYGMGDVRFVTIAGLVLGTHSVTLPLYALVIIPPMVALPIALVTAVVRRDAQVGIAFGPYLALGTCVAAFAQPLIPGLA